ncbi:MAG TPA: cytochrome c oxidase subunit 3 [Rudaea sp.]|nr:cytochrome c oxidase subunit 3 [Rudaea sp.]
MTRRIAIAGDVSQLPDFGYGSVALGWWGTFGFMLIEGMAFVLAIGVYLYLIPFESHWPPSPPPGLRYGTAFTLIALASLVPNAWVLRAARRGDLVRVRRGLIVMVAVGVLLLVVRGFELTALNARWDENTYGSILWAIMLIHTTHLATDVYDSCPLAVLVYVRDVDGRRYSDVEDNATYWNFVVLSWLAIYALVYWLPRALA